MHPGMILAAFGERTSIADCEVGLVGPHDSVQRRKHALRTRRSRIDGFASRRPLHGIVDLHCVRAVARRLLRVGRARLTHARAFAELPRWPHRLRADLGPASADVRRVTAVLTSRAKWKWLI